MKKITILLFVILAFATVTKAQGKFGLGIIVGEPTGISGKLHLSNTSSVDGALGWSFNKYGSVHIHADYLYNFAQLSSEAPFYLGVGGRVKLANNDEGQDLRLAVRVPVGLAYQPSTVPIDLFLEIVPMLDLTPSSDFNWNAAIGIRYYFN